MKKRKGRKKLYNYVIIFIYMNVCVCVYTNEEIIKKEIFKIRKIDWTIGHKNVHQSKGLTFLFN